MNKKVSAILLFIIVCAVAAVAVGFLSPYKPTSFVVDGDVFSAAVEDGATLLLDLDNDSNRKEWSIIETPGSSQCFVKDYVTVTENITEFHIIAIDDGKGVMTFQSVSGDGTTENYELELTISRHKKRYLQMDTVSFVKTESGIEDKANRAEDKTDTEQNTAVFLFSDRFLNYYIPGSGQNQVFVMFFCGKNEISTGIFAVSELL